VCGTGTTLGRVGRGAERQSRAVTRCTMRAGQPDCANLSRRFMCMFNMCIIGSVYNNLLVLETSSPPLLIN